ncbi:MAG: transketolase [Clostridia bacterium]|nr:transketolase [Clostridia bacterium]
MRNSFVKKLVEIAKDREDIILITGDLGYNALDLFIENFPDRFINAGIAEQNMMGVAAGMAKEGKTVVVYSIGNFTTLRCIEQIRNDCAYNNADVKIVSVGGGFAYGTLGMTHHATEDIAMMRALPNVKVFSPADPLEAIACTEEMLKQKGTCYLRLNRGNEEIIHGENEKLDVKSAIKMNDGNDIAIFSTGNILYEAKKACEELKEKGFAVGLYSFPMIKPIDKQTILRCINESKLIITIEEHNIMGGFGGAVAEVMSEVPHNSKLLRIGLNDEYTSIVGKQNYLREQYKMSAKEIEERIISVYNH